MVVTNKLISFYFDFCDGCTFQQILYHLNIIQGTDLKIDNQDVSDTKDYQEEFKIIVNVFGDLWYFFNS